jgi:hypothetical protein
MNGNEFDHTVKKRLCPNGMMSGAPCRKPPELITVSGGPGCPAASKVRATTVEPVKPGVPQTTTILPSGAKAGTGASLPSLALPAVLSTRAAGPRGTRGVSAASNTAESKKR